jgi:hypothetical protein
VARKLGLATLGVLSDRLSKDCLRDVGSSAT